MAERYPPGFRPGHVPLKTIKRRKKTGGVCDNFPTAKYVGEGSIRTSKPLVADLLMQFDANPRVRKISSYPIKVVYEEHDRYGPIGTQEAYPEIGVLMVDGSVHYLDVIPFHHQRDSDFIVGEKVRAVLQASCGASYAIKDEEEIFVEPRMSNLRNIWAHHHYKDTDVVSATRLALHRLGFPTTVAEVQAKAKVADFEWRDWAGRSRHVPYVHPVFSALKHLHTRGELRLDVSKPLSFATAVHTRHHGGRS